MNLPVRTFDLPRPYDLDTEQQLLGELLLNNAAAERLIGIVEPHHFAEPLHQRLYDALARALRAGLAATPFTLKPEFDNDASLRELGGAGYFVTLAARANECLDPAAWAHALKNLAYRRALIATARGIQDEAFRAPIETEPAAIAERAETLLAEAFTDTANAPERFRPLGELAREVMSAKDEAPSVKFGLGALDDITGGLRAKELVIVGARPGMGKTAFAGHLALEAAKQAGASRSSPWKWRRARSRCASSRRTPSRKGQPCPTTMPAAAAWTCASVKRYSRLS